MHFLDCWLKLGETSQKQELILAKTGIHPKQDNRAWKQWVVDEQTYSEKMHASFEELIRANRFYYLFGFIISCQMLLGEKIDQLYSNAPIMMVIGPALMRMRRHTDWPGLSVLGVVVFLVGAVLTVTYVSDNSQIGNYVYALTEAFCLVGLAYGY